MCTLLCGSRFEHSKHVNNFMYCRGNMTDVLETQNNHLITTRIDAYSPYTSETGYNDNYTNIMV